MDFTLDSVKSLIAAGKKLSADEVPHTIVEVDCGPHRLIIKYGRAVWKTEAIAMEMVHQRTAVPVPKLFAYLFERTGTSRCGYIVMEKVPGVMLSSVIDTLDDSAVKEVTKQLAKYLKELTKLDSEGWGMPGKKGIYHKTYFRYISGPARIQSTKEFIDYFASAAGAPLPEDPAKANQLLQDIDLSRAPVFSHGDLVPENIMYDVSSRQITSIIDWECAGCFPYFWNTFIARKRNDRKFYKNWKEIYSSTMDSCTAGENLLLGYYFDADIYGMHESSDRDCACCE